MPETSLNLLQRSAGERRERPREMAEIMEANVVGVGVASGGVLDSGPTRCPRNVTRTLGREEQRVLVSSDEVVEMRGEFCAELFREGHHARAGVSLRRLEDETFPAHLAPRSLDSNGRPSFVEIDVSTSTDDDGTFCREAH